VERALNEVVAALTAYVPGGRLEDDLAVILIENLAEPAGGQPRGARTRHDAERIHS
jgi:hypothetical protein